LFLPGAWIVAVSPKTDGQPSVEIMLAADYESHRSAFFASTSFYESEIARQTDRFGCVAQVFSTYESRFEPDGLPFMRGVNAIQLLWQQDRWWIISAAWQHESPDMRIPAAYMTSDSSVKS
jgi:hypothetical protein